MARHDVQKIFEQAKKLIEENKIFFVEDIISLLPITKPTFYSYFKIGSDEINELKELIDKNKVELKVSLRAKWYKSENATLQMALMQLICTPEEHRLLQQNYTDVTTQGEKVNQAFTFITEVTDNVRGKNQDNTTTESDT